MPSACLKTSVYRRQKSTTQFNRGHWKPQIHAPKIGIRTHSLCVQAPKPLFGNLYFFIIVVIQLSQFGPVDYSSLQLIPKQLMMQAAPW